MSEHGQVHAADYLLEYLYSKGVRRIFGIPGDELELFDAIGHSKVKFITTRHEQGAAFMAAAIGKMTALPGVCISTLGPGAANLVTAVADAHQSRIPLIALSGQLESTQHSVKPLAHQYIDLEKLFAPITKKTFFIKRADDIIPVIDEAFRIALEPRQGPVHITLAADVMEEVVLKRPSTRGTIHREVPISSAPIEVALKLIQGSSFPVAFLGQNALSMPFSARKVFEKAGVPVVTSFTGKGSFPENSPWSLGVVSRHVKDRLSEIFDKADLFVVYGYDYVEGVHPRIFEGKKVLLIDASPAKAEKIFKPQAQITDMRMVDVLCEKMLRGAYRSLWEQKYITEIRADREKHVLRGQDMESYPFNPFKVIHALQRVSSGKEMIVSDVGIHKQVLGMGYKVTKPHGIHFSNGLSTMGFALPFAAGLRNALPRSGPIIAICGDGGFLMNVQELETIRRYDLDVKVVVFVDNAFGMIKANLIGKYKRVRNLDFSNPDFELLARSFRIDHMTADETTDLEDFWRKILRHKGPLLVSIPIRYA